MTEIASLTAETAMEADHKFGIQKTAGVAGTSATFALIGGLEYSAQTPVATDIEGAAGYMYGVGTGSMTGDINVTVPTGVVGQRMGILCEGDIARSVGELIIKGAVGVDINGVGAAAEWSRLFIKGECVVLRCTAANTWWVEYDGRKPACGRLDIAEGVSYSDNVSTLIDFASGDIDQQVGDLADTTNDRIVPRRACTLAAGLFCDTSWSMDTDDNLRTFLSFKDSGDATIVNATMSTLSPSTNKYLGQTHSFECAVVTGDYLQYKVLIHYTDGSFSALKVDAWWREILR